MHECKNAYFQINMGSKSHEGIRYQRTDVVIPEKVVVEWIFDQLVLTETLTELVLKVNLCT